MLPQLSKWGAADQALARPADTARLGGIQRDSECLHASQITTDFEHDPGETGSGQGCAACNAGRGVWTPHRASLFYDGKVFYSAVDWKPKRVAPERLARLRHITASPQVAQVLALGMSMGDSPFGVGYSGHGLRSH